MRILLMADIHIGSIKDSKYVYDVVTNIIDREVSETHSDMVVILGDYFDRLCKVNEECVSLAIDIMTYLVRACSREKTAIRLIYGTESHEMNQYKLFNYHLTSSNIDMKVIDTVTEENIDGHSILYIPEEYTWDKIKHYAPYLNSSNHYDYIFGHGIIEDGMPGIVSTSHARNQNKEKQVPRFKSGELGGISDICVFGHYHVKTDMDNSVYYLGSLFRNSFGEETPKYYGLIEDKSISFIENTEAYVYKTYEFNPLSDVYQNSDNIINELNKIKSDNEDIFNGIKSGKIRIIFKTPNDVDSSFKINAVNILSNEPCISMQIKEPNIELIDEIQEDLEDEFDFVIDPSMNIIDKLFRFILTQHENPPMTIKELHGYVDEIVSNYVKINDDNVDGE